MSKYRYIKLDEKWLNKLRETAHFYGADIVCGAGTDWVLKTAEAENKTLFEIISYLDNAPSEDAAEAYATLHAAYTELTRTCMTLTEKVKVLNEQYDALLDRNVELGDEVEGLKAHLDVSVAEQIRLADEVADRKAIAEQYQRQFEDARADTVREAIVRIEEKAESCGLYVVSSNKPIDTVYQISKTQLDQIAQEMLEGKCREQTLNPSKE